ncbi:MAG: ribbon-helix-helix protein, CopG family [Patescibacteria group bacterium]
MADKPALRRKQIYLDRPLAQKLRALARQNRQTESALIRKALAEYLAAEERRSTLERDNPVLQMIGMFEGDPGDARVSEKTSDYVAEAVAQDKT